MLFAVVLPLDGMILSAINWESRERLCERDLV